MTAPAGTCWRCGKEIATPVVERSKNGFSHVSVDGVYPCTLLIHGTTLPARITRFSDIPQFTRSGSWECDFPLVDAWKQIEQWQKEDGLDLDPDFQRGHVWTEAQQIAWIEFFLRGGKTGRVIYFNHPGWMRGWQGGSVIVDGKQRLEAIRRFTQNEIPAFGIYCGDFTDSLRIVQTIKLNMNDLKTRAEVLQWYIDLNAGGTPHSEAEIQRVRALLAEAIASKADEQ